MKLWNWWCRKVEEHNSKLEDDDFENFCHPCDIFDLIWISTVIAFLICGLTNTFSYKNFISSFVFSFMAISVTYFISWKLNEK